MRLQLQEKEERLLAEIQRLEQEQIAWESQHADLRLELVEAFSHVVVGTLLRLVKE